MRHPFCRQGLRPVEPQPDARNDPATHRPSTGDWVFPAVFLIRSGVMPVLLIAVVTIFPLLGVQVNGSAVAALAALVGTEVVIDITIIVWLRARGRSG